MRLYSTDRFILSFLVVAMCFSSQPLSARESENANQYPTAERWHVTGQFDGNRIEDDLENNGMIVSHRVSGHSGFEWPRGGSSYAVYASGLWLAGRVDGEIRTAVAEYGPEFTPGVFDANGSEPEHRLYKLNQYDMTQPALSIDFQEWPVEFGAPFVDANEDGVYSPMPNGPDYPEMRGDQMIWYAAHDNIASNHSVFNTAPLGLEIQTTIWGYDRNDELGDMMFVRSLIINKGTNNIMDTYCGLWSDPDIGDAGDDFIGCDTTLGLGFAYNDGPDSQYGDAAPAVGYDFFQGPIVLSEGDTAIAYGRYLPGYRNLKMTSFTKYINADDVYTDPSNAEEAYFYMRGFKRDGSPFINPVTGEPTKFVNPDDPNLDTGMNDNIWVDGDDNPADDRRFLMNAGPFNMAPGDSQEVIYAILMAQGTDALNSVTLLKEIDQTAQNIADNFYTTPADTLFAEFVEAFNPVILGDNLNDDGIANNGELIRVSFSIRNLGSTSESYLVTLRPLTTGIGYEGASFEISNLPPAPITYTLQDEEVPLFYIPANFTAENLVIDVDINRLGTSEWSQSLLTIPVEILSYEPDPTLYWIENVQGITDAQVGLRVIDPAELALHNDTYQITFSDEVFTAEGTLEMGLGINLFNLTTGDQLLDRHLLPDENQFNFPITDGFKLVTSDVPVGLNGIYQISNAGGEIPGGLEHDVNEDLLWIHWFSAPEYPTEQIQGGWFFITHAGGTANDLESFNARVFRNTNWERAAGQVFEMRFSSQGSLAYFAYTTGSIIQLPFELWNLGDTEDPEDDFQMITWILDLNGNDVFDFSGDDLNSSAENDPSSDWIYWRNPTDTSPGSAGYLACALDPDYGFGVADGEEVMARTRLMNWNSYASHEDSIPLSSLSSSNPAEWTSQDTFMFIDAGWFLDPWSLVGQVTIVGDHAFGTVLHFPEVGSTTRWVANRPLNSGVTAHFSPMGLITSIEDEIIPLAFNLAQNYPNPFNPSTTITFEIPEQGNIRLVVYDLLGREVRVLRDGVAQPGAQTLLWDGRDMNGLAVSSGVYLVRLDAAAFHQTRKMVHLK